MDRIDLSLHLCFYFRLSIEDYLCQYEDLYSCESYTCQLCNESVRRSKPDILLHLASDDAHRAFTPEQYFQTYHVATPPPKPYVKVFREF